MRPISTGGVRRFLRTITFHIVLVAFAAVLGTWGAGWVMEELLVRQALDLEAEYFWKQRQENSQFPLPDTRNLTAFFHDDPTMPEELRNLGPGFHDLKGHHHSYNVLVSERKSDRLILIFEGEQVRALSLWFGLVPLALVLIVVYASLFLVYRFYRSSVSPVARLADQVESLQLESSQSPDFDVSDLPQGTDREIVVLGDALKHLVQRVNDFVSREREFTRDVSHELRSPLTVMRVACDLVLKDDALAERVRKPVTKIQRAAVQMTNLVEAFLLLAREPDRDIEASMVCVNDLIAEEVDRASILLEDRSVIVKTDFFNRLLVRAPERVVSVVLNNLLRNACTYTDEGSVMVSIQGTEVTITDTGIGMSEQDRDLAFHAFSRGSQARPGGHGVGLNIVGKLSDRFGWPVTLRSAPGEGTTALVAFPDAVTEDL